MQKNPVLLLIFDGWGVSRGGPGDAIAAAQTPCWDGLLSTCPHTELATSGAAVGLPDGQMGNSEVGHMCLGAGRVMLQDYPRISRAAENGELLQQAALADAVAQARDTGRCLHIMGLLSPGGVHSHESHIHALVEAASGAGCKNIQLHAFLDGRDTPPQSAERSLRAMQKVFDQIGHGVIATLCGRYYAMDRDQRWDRTELAYRTITEARAEYSAASPLAALEAAYQRGETDEFVQATAIDGAVGVCDGDVVVFMNFRGDRARQLTRAMSVPDFDRFQRARPINLARFVCLTEYAADLPVAVAFAPQRPSHTLGEVVAETGLRQLRMAETEKYAHVTFFFNGGRERAFAHESRILIPSPKVATYDLQPEMSAPELTEKLLAALRGGRHDLIVCNYANADMVGHTGVFPAALEAVSCLDRCLDKVVSTLREVGGEALITADHGNIEQMCDLQTGTPYTAHSNGPVPLVYVGAQGRALRRGGSLAHVAGTLLHMLGIPAPKEMHDYPSLLTHGHCGA